MCVLGRPHRVLLGYSLSFQIPLLWPGLLPFPHLLECSSRTSNISPGGSVETGFYTVCFCVVLFAGVLSGQEHNNCYLFSCWPHWMFVSCVSFLGCCNK